MLAVVCSWERALSCTREREALCQPAVHSARSFSPFPHLVTRSQVTCQTPPLSPEVSHLLFQMLSLPLTIPHPELCSMHREDFRNPFQSKISLGVVILCFTSHYFLNYQLAHFSSWSLKIGRTLCWEIVIWYQSVTLSRMIAMRTL